MVHVTHDGKIVADRFGSMLIGEVRSNTLDREGEGLIDSEIGDWQALRLIGCEQVSTGIFFHDKREFPGQIVGIRDASVGTIAPGWRHDMGSIADQEDPTLLNTVGHDGGHIPCAHLPDLHCQIRNTHSGADQLKATFTRIILRTLALFGMVGDIEHTSLATRKRCHRTLHLLIHHITEEDVAATESGEQISLEVDEELVREDAIPMSTDAKLAADGAIVPICGHQVASAYGPFSAGVLISDNGTDPMGILREGDEPGIEAQVCPQRLSLSAQDRLQQVLRDEAKFSGTGWLLKVALALRIIVEFLAREALDAHDREVIKGRGGGANGLFRADRVIDLHRALVKARSAREGGDAAMALDQQARCSLASEEEGG